ncbi:MAG: cupin domain-containing protein [Sphingomonas bacterium]
MSDTHPTAVIASRKPFYRELRAGQRILWCACGRSKRQPFCDGRSHEGTGFEPLEYKASRDEEVLLCGCKQTGTPPFCDGAHSNLPGGYRDEERDETMPVIPPDAAGFARLDGECYIVSPPADADEDFSCATLVAESLGAKHQSQFLLTVRGEASPVLSSSAGDVILWVRSGTGSVEIGERRFGIDRPSGISIRRGETFRLHRDGAPLVIYASVCPGAEAFERPPAMTPQFDADYPVRVVGIDEEARTAMGPRYFQLLVDERHGLDNSAQFIGHIPQSRAEMHRHLYEEALIILSGSGMIWNETRRAQVKAGDVIFFPRKHLHSLECTAAEGMDVVGLIHPGTNPGINY